MCLINDGFEDTGHFLLSCHFYDIQRHDLLGTVDVVLLTNSLSNLSNEILLRVLLYGDEIWNLQVSCFMSKSRRVAARVSY